MSEKVIVGMSGGVDSSVSAWLLQQQGFSVEGLFMFNWAEDEAGYCDAADDYQNAALVCEELDIPLHRADFSADYREHVFQNFLDEYAAGRTPNPDLLCNREIKFKSFLQYAQRLGAQRVATGHYASLRHSSGHTELLMAKDQNKDQTYFLALVSGEALSHVLFPLGEYTKPEVRALAAQAGLPNHARKDSTGICFIGERPMKDFLSNYLQAKQGPIYSLDHGGREIGRHDGLMFHTVGQRRGLGVGGLAGASEAPWFVVRKDIATNSLWVSQDTNHPGLMCVRIEVADMHWVNQSPSLPMNCMARARHRQELQSCLVQQGDDDTTLIVEFPQPQRAIALGQYLVLYSNEVCLGGGCVVATRSLADPE